MSQIATQQKWTLASYALNDAYTDFILSRQAMQCARATLEFYRDTAGAFLAWLEGQSVTSPQELTARLARSYLAGLSDSGKKDTTINAHARAIRALVIFWHAKKYIPEIISYKLSPLTICQEWT